MLSLTVAIVTPVTLPINANVTTVSAATVKLSKKTLTLITGKSKTLKVTGTTKTVTWSSSDKTIAKVTKAGKVTAVSTGTATITAKVGSKKYTCKVTVKPFQDQTITYGTLSFKIPKDATITSDGTSTDVTSYFQYIGSDNSSITIRDYNLGTSYTTTGFEDYIKGLVTQDSQTTALSTALGIELSLSEFQQESVSLDFGDGLLSSYGVCYNDQLFMICMIYDIYSNGHLYEFSLCSFYDGVSSALSMQDEFAYTINTVTVNN